MLPRSTWLSRVRYRGGDHRVSDPNLTIPPLTDVFGEIGVTLIGTALAFAAVIVMVKLAI